MSTEDSKRVVRAFYDAGNVGDVDKLLALLSDDVRWTNIGTTKFSMTCNGKQDLVENLMGPVFGRLQKRHHRARAEHDRGGRLGSGPANG